VICKPIPSAQAARKPEENEISKLCEQCGKLFEPRAGIRRQASKVLLDGLSAAFNSQHSQRSPTCSASAQMPAVIPQPKQENAPADSSEDFDWSNDSSIILREQAATAVYFDKEGSLVIRQHRWPDDDTFIYIAEASINNFLDKLTDVCGIPSAGK
jgi:hypothetical protein